jgi:anti-sigma regulatory factor (Ser/Thr protein kinase)
MAEKVGPENARIAPVIAITEKISNAIVHALKVDDAYVLERNIKSDIQAM